MDDPILEKWFEIKVDVRRKKSSVFLKEGEIYYAHVGENVGFELNGKGQYFSRPVLILKVISQNCTICLPLTTKISDKNKKFRFSPENINFLPKKGFVVLNCPQTLDRKRFYLRLGKLPKDIFSPIKNRSAEEIFGG